MVDDILPAHPVRPPIQPQREFSLRHSKRGKTRSRMSPNEAVNETPTTSIDHFFLHMSWERQRSPRSIRSWRENHSSYPGESSHCHPGQTLGDSLLVALGCTFSPTGATVATNHSTCWAVLTGSSSAMFFRRSSRKSTVAPLSAIFAIIIRSPP